MPGEDSHLYTCALAGAQAWGFNPRSRVIPLIYKPWRGDGRSGAAGLRRPFGALDSGWGPDTCAPLGLTAYAFSSGIRFPLQPGNSFASSLIPSCLPASSQKTARKSVVTGRSRPS
jgi:hypothetical protein